MKKRKKEENGLILVTNQPVTGGIAGATNGKVIHYDVLCFSF